MCMERWRKKEKWMRCEIEQTIELWVEKRNKKEICSKENEKEKKKKRKRKEKEKKKK